jgi:hypothetical protein
MQEREGIRDVGKGTGDYHPSPGLGWGIQELEMHLKRLMQV